MAQLYRYDWVFVPWLHFVWPSSGLSNSIWLRVTFFGLSTQIDQSEKLIRINSWLKQYLRELNRFNSWLKQLSRELTLNHLTPHADPQILIQIDSWLMQLHRELTQNQLTIKADSQVLIQIESWLRKTFDNESTHDSTLSRTHVCPWGDLSHMMFFSQSPGIPTRNARFIVIYLSETLNRPADDTG